MNVVHVVCYKTITVPENIPNVESGLVANNLLQ